MALSNQLAQPLLLPATSERQARRLVAPPGDDTPGKVKHVRDYSLKPGEAHFYDVGVLHSPSRKGPTKLIRIEGMNMERVKRKAFEVA